MSLTAISATRPNICDPEPDGLLAQLMPRAVEVEGGQVRIRPNAMKLNRYYLAEVDGKPYVYRRVSQDEVEVYGLAEAAS